MSTIVETKLRCPKCKSPDLDLTEIGTWTSSFRAVRGRFDRSLALHEPQSVDKLNAYCRQCKHGWKPRRAFSIDDVIAPSNEGAGTRTPE